MMSKLASQLKNPRLYAPLVTGAAFCYLLEGGRTAGWLLVSDMLFTAAALYLAIGLWCVVLNIGMFDSTTYGFKKVFRIFFKKRQAGRTDAVAEYAQYVQNRKRRQGYGKYFFMAALALATSILTGFIA